MTENILDDDWTRKSFTLQEDIENFWFKLAFGIISLAPAYIIYALYASFNETVPEKEYNFEIFIFIVLTMYILLPFVIAILSFLIVRKIRWLQQIITVKFFFKRDKHCYFYYILFPLTFIINLLTIYTCYLTDDLTLNNFDDALYFVYLLCYNWALYYFFKRIHKLLPVLLSFDKKSI